MKQQLDAKAPREGGTPASRAVVLQRTVSPALRSTQQNVSLRQQILGWGIVVGIFAAALATWSGLIRAALSIYRSI